MKKAIALLLTIVMMFTLCACGNKAYDKSAEAYKNISSAYDLVESFGSDVYEAWRLGIYEDDEILDAGDLADELSLTEEELELGAAYIILDGDVNADEDYSGYFDIAVYLYDNKFSAFIWIVSNAYEATGKTAEIQNYLDNAKTLMKELSEKYSDYEHYPNLKEFYTTTTAFFDFCQNPTGSFEQVKTTINDYKNEAREYKNDLAYIFDEEDFEEETESEEIG